MSKRLLTGIVPTGNIHLGNYLGAMKPFVDLQHEYDLFVFVADLHALNQIHDAETLRAGIRTISSAWLAVGLDPSKVTLWQQSAVAAHSELAQILGSIAPFGLLERSHAYKDALANGKNPNVGLFTYPILMAADILLYEPDFVPVGKDQQQHIEIMSDLAGSFNHLFGNTFKIAEGMIATEAGLLPGLDGRKMSKSYGNTIGLFDSAEEVTKKVMKITTDSAGPTDPKDPEKDLLFAFHRQFSPDQLGELESRYRAGTITYKESKDILAANINSFLEPIRARKAELDAKPDYLEDVIKEGNAKANQIANATLERVKSAVGLI
ncbi:MAG: tryptophan--tRNA ligase [bacterium]